MPERRAVLGIKRTCHGCSTRFYDLCKNPVTCPKCGCSFDPEFLIKKRVKTHTKAHIKEPLLMDFHSLEDDVPFGSEGDLENDTLIEDTCDLGSEEDDVAEVMDRRDEERGM